jgi:hypothetical protein
MHWLEGEFPRSEWSADDLIRRALFKLLSGDARLQRIFGGRIFESDILPPQVGLAGPELYVINFSDQVEDSPGIRVGEVRLSVMVAFPWPRGEVLNGGPGLGTLFRAINAIILGPRKLLPTPSETTGEPVDLVAPPVTLGTRAPGAELTETAVIYRLHQEVIYRVRLDPATQRPLDLD